MATTSRLRAEERNDFTVGHRDCTAMEELGYCLTNAMGSYGDCMDGANFLQKAGCTIAYQVDWYSCYAELVSPFN